MQSPGQLAQAIGCEPNLLRLWRRRKQMPFPPLNKKGRVKFYDVRCAIVIKLLRIVGHSQKNAEFAKVALPHVLWWLYTEHPEVWAVFGNVPDEVRESFRREMKRNNEAAKIMSGLDREAQAFGVSVDNEPYELTDRLPLNERVESCAFVNLKRIAKDLADMHNADIAESYKRGQPVAAAYTVIYAPE